MRHFLSVSVRTRLQIDGPYDEAFLEKLQKCPTEDDGSVEFAVAKVSPKLIFPRAGNSCPVLFDGSGFLL